METYVVIYEQINSNQIDILTGLHKQAYRYSCFKNVAH